MSTEERYCINSVKLIKDKIRMDFTDNGDSVKRDFKQKATPEFYTALENLTKPTLNILGLGALLIKRIKPYAVSFKYAEDKTMSAVISSMFYVPSADREIVVTYEMSF